MASSSSTRLNPAYEDSSYNPSVQGPLRGCRLVIVIIVSVALALVIGLIIGRFAIPRHQSSDEQLLKALRRDADEDISAKMMEAVDPQNIEETLRILSEKPHIAGRQGDFDLVKFIQKRFREHGLEVQTTPYDVLLSYPNDHVANSVRLLNANGDIVYDSVTNESNISHLEGVVPPFNAYAPARKVEGQLVYVNFGRVNDYDWLRTQGVDVTGRIVLAKLGQIFRGDIVDIAADNGAIGVVTFPDPADYAGVTYGDFRFAPEAWWMPPDGAQRGTVFTGFSDPLTPGYPANRLAYRYAEDNARVSLPKIPCQPVSYGAAKELLSRMTGDVAPASWQGALNTEYRMGPGFVDTDLKVELNVTNKNQRAMAENVFGIIRGTVEPDRYVLIGNHRDAWIYGAIDPSSGTAVMMEIARVMGLLVKKGQWKPRRSIIFCSWGAEEYGLIGSSEWVEQYIATLRERAVGYLNVDTAIRGNDTLRVGATPLMHNLAYEASRKVKNPNPSEVEAGRTTVYDTWQHISTGSTKELPKISGLGSGSDYAPLLQMAGITAMDAGYVFNSRKYRMQSYPLYHTEYETFDIVKTQHDRNFEISAALSRFMGEVARNLADSLILPFDLDGYTKGLKYIKETLDASSYGERLKAMLDNYGLLDDVINGFGADIIDFKQRLEMIDKNNPYAVRQVNDQILLLEKAFLISEGLPTRPNKKHILFAENANDAYAESSFPGLIDLLFKIDSAPDAVDRWERTKRHFSTILHTIQSAGATLRDVTTFMSEEL